MERIFSSLRNCRILSTTAWRPASFSKVCWLVEACPPLVLRGEGRFRVLKSTSPSCWAERMLKVVPAARVDLGGEAVQLVLYVGEKGLERGGPSIATPRPFHFGQHRSKRQFQRIVKLAQPVADQTILQGFGHGQSQPGRTPALGFQSRPPARGQAGPAVIAFLGIEQIGGQAQVETARRRFCPEADCANRARRSAGP